MSRCIDPEVGRLLPAYELKTLSENDTESIELHLMECEHCFGELMSFKQEAELLRSGDEMIDIAREAAQEMRPQLRSLPKRLWKRIWPNTPVVFRPALAYVVILLLLYPAIEGIIGPADESIRSVQTLRLLPGRGGTEDVLQISATSDGLLSFVFRGAVASESYELTIYDSHGQLIYRDDAFDGFDDYETGWLLLPLAEIGPGDYRLVLTNPRAEPSSRTQEYSFSIKK